MRVEAIRAEKVRKAVAKGAAGREKEDKLEQARVKAGWEQAAIERLCRIKQGVGGFRGKDGDGSGGDMPFLAVGR